MSTTQRVWIGIASGVAVLLIGITVFFSATPVGKSIWNNWFYAVQKVDDTTNYDTRKTVEDTCRAMIASYKTDCDTYAQYKDSANEDKQAWAEQAKMRANKTANSYNEFVLRNTFVWADNIPSDIDVELKTLQ